MVFEKQYEQERDFVYGEVVETFINGHKHRTGEDIKSLTPILKEFMKSISIDLDLNETLFDLYEIELNDFRRRQEEQEEYESSLWEDENRAYTQIVLNPQVESLNRM